MTHSVIPPSSAGIWGKPDGCTFWVTMNQRYPEDEPNQESKDGTASHEIGSELIEKASRGFLNIAWSYFEGKSATNGVVFTEDMYEGSKIYAMDVMDVMRSSSVFSAPNLSIEKRIDCPSIHELSDGTPDCWIYSHNTFELWLWDYKFGHDGVEAFENWQGINYLAGIIEKLQLSDEVVIYLRIIQPRYFHREGPIREWKTTVGQVKGYFISLREKAKESLSLDAKANTGSHCKNCPGRHACPPALTAGLRLYEVSIKTVPVELSTSALGVQLAIVTRARKQLEYLESGYKEQVSSLLKSGKSVIGWGVEPTYGHQKWDKPVNEILSLGELLGMDLMQKKPITPKQALTLGIDAEIIKEYSSKSQTGLKVVQDDGSKVRQIFSQP